MTLADALSAPPPAPAKGPRCSIGALLEDLPPEDSDALRAALADPRRWSHAALSARLRENGYRVADGTIARHRRGDCLCQP